jgi:Cft2 family RNA processing exonuclease
VFHWHDGLKLTKADLAIDFCRRQPRAFISHAHSDHIARHEYALCTPATAALYQYRLGRRMVREMPYRQPIEWGGLRLTTYPAGHCLGSAMLLAEDDGQRLLYTGDFKLSASATAESAELPEADLLVIESTFGQPHYRLPPREQVLQQLYELVHAILRSGAVPIVEAYALGKGQEITRLLTAQGIRVRAHRNIFEINRVYESLGVALGEYALWEGMVEPGEVLVVPPRSRGPNHGGREVRIAVTGWAIDEQTKYRLRVDHALPLSDHADYDELFEAVRRVHPKKIFCTHGPESFVDRLCDAGFDAHRLDRPRQRRLF